MFLKDFVNKGEFDALVLGWSMTPLDPDLYQLFHSSQTGPEQLNFVAYKSPEADDLIVEIRQEYDRERQRALAHTLHRRIAEDQPYTFPIRAEEHPRARQEDRNRRTRAGRPRERYVKIYPTKGGNISYYFNRWR